MNEIEIRHQATKDFAIKARELVLSRLNDPSFALLISMKTSRTDVVTQIDEEVERLLTAEITTHFPADAVMGEEYGESGGHGEYEWIVDPIDGTTNFIYGFPAFAISIAVRRTLDSQVVSGVVYDIPRNRLYEATHGGGAYANGSPISVTDQTDVSNSLIGTGFSYSDVIRVRQGKIISNMITKIRDIRRAGAASLDLCMVAAGELDGYYEVGLKPWDYMAGALIVQEAGGFVSGGNEPSPSSEMIVATNGKIHSALWDLIVASS